MFSKKYQLSLIFLIFSSLTFCLSRTTEDSASRNHLLKKLLKQDSNFGFHKKTRLERTLDVLSRIEMRSELLESELEVIKTQIENYDEPDENYLKLCKKFDSKEEQLEGLKQFLDQPLTPGLGDAILEGVIGHKSKFTQDMVLGGGFGAIGEAVLLGSAYKSAEVIGDNIGNSLNTVVSSGFNYGLGWLHDFFSFFKRLIFNHGFTSFDVQEIKAWKHIVNNGFGRLEKTLRDSAKYDSRSKDFLARKVNNDENEKNDNQKKVFSVWKLVANEYAIDCDFLVLAIEKRKGYYKKGKDQFVLHIATQLQNSLNGMKDLLLKAENLKEFASLLEVKSGFPLLVKRLTDLFDVLASNLTLGSFSLERKKSSKTIGLKKKKKYWGDDYDNYPHSYI